METGKLLNQLIGPSNDSRSAMTRSEQPLNADLVLKLAELMAQMQDFSPNQTLPPGTPDVWLKAWEEMVSEMGIDRFEKALWRAMRNSDFLPNPNDIQTADDVMQEALAAEKRARADKKQQAEWDEYVKRWKAERALEAIAAANRAATLEAQKEPLTETV